MNIVVFSNAFPPFVFQTYEMLISKSDYYVYQTFKYNIQTHTRYKKVNTRENPFEFLPLAKKKKILDSIYNYIHFVSCNRFKLKFFLLADLFSQGIWGISLLRATSRIFGWGQFSFQKMLIVPLNPQSPDISPRSPLFR